MRETRVAKTGRARTRLSRGAVDLSVDEQVGLVAALSMSHIAFNRWRMALGGATSGLCSLPVLRARRLELSAVPGKQVVVTGSGAHLVSLAADIQKRVSSLCDRDLFLERPVKDPAARNNAAAAEQGPTGAAVSLPGSPPTSAPDVRIVLGLNKVGDPGTVKVVASMINQEHSNSSANTILVGVCPCDDDKYDELAEMLETHLPQIDALLRDGVMVRGACRPVHLMLGCDFPAQCCLLGHKGATATQPCLGCKCTRWPSDQQALLDAIYGTLQDVSGSGSLRERTRFADRMAVDDATRMAGKPSTHEHHCSVARSPLRGIDPGKIVPIPLQTTQGVNRRPLRLAVEMVMEHRSATEGAAAGRQAGKDFALELVAFLHERVRVRSTSFHGGLFIGRECHTIGDHSAILCSAIVCKVSLAHLAAYEEACSLRNRVRKTLNREAIVPGGDVLAFRADTSAKRDPDEGELWLVLDIPEVPQFDVPRSRLSGDVGQHWPLRRTGAGGMAWAVRPKRRQVSGRNGAGAGGGIYEGDGSGTRGGLGRPRALRGQSKTGCGRGPQGNEGDRQTAPAEQAAVAGARRRECEGGQAAQEVGSGHY